MPTLLLMLASAVSMTPSPSASAASPVALLPSASDVPSLTERVMPVPRQGAGEQKVRFTPVLTQLVAAGRLSSTFGARNDPFDGSLRVHKGIDIAAPYGTSVRAAEDGVVIFAGRAGGYGELVEIGHGGGIETLYGHLSTVFVRQGLTIRRGDVIGALGSSGRSTGNHLHFEVREFGVAVDPQSAVFEDQSPAWGYVMPLPPPVPHWQGWREEAGRLPSAY